MVKCDACDFDGTNGTTKENTQFPLGAGSEGRYLGKDNNGKPKWGSRVRCPLCGNINSKASSKPKATKGIEV